MLMNLLMILMAVMTFVFVIADPYRDEALTKQKISAEQIQPKQSSSVSHSPQPGPEELS
ncbi:hypothetical protein EC844_11826 [Acinetobacter calcoaceticus]|uniref:Uncharacterized protein n=1 Tax=Acinetobacter calcoaceticus TaxID=471 RepID=A0A4R1XPZ9_ACICA|nr:hypothetical protein EC844_11826 [Acinetobacter calcoaceticus]